MTSNICASKAEWPGQGRQGRLRQTAWLSSNSWSWENVAVLRQDGEGARGSEDRWPDSQWSESRCGIKMLSRGSQGPLWLYESCLETILPLPHPPPQQAPHSRPVETGKAQTADHRGACCTVVVLKTKEETVMPAGLWKTWHTPHVSIRLRFCGHKRQDQTLVQPCFPEVAAGGRTAAREVSVPGNGLVSENWTWEHSPWGWGELIHWATGLTPWPPSY